MKTDLQIWDELGARLRNPEAYPPRVVAGLNELPEQSAITRRATLEDRAEYEYELIVRAGQSIDAGLSEAEADRLALADLGCFDFWLHAKQINEWVDDKVPARRSRAGQFSRRRENVFCTRCESVGHAVEACPYSFGDEFVTRIAVKRRERRARREVAA
ncbi:MAG: hypothetical protein H0X14_00030 [Acidobacteria bacterium]|nr:hypothetical protein [Acidobacteriota bacterium]